MHGARRTSTSSAEQLRDLANAFLEIVRSHTGKPFPQDPYEQLDIAIKAVFRSWNGKRAIDYRKQFKITPQMANGTAVNIVTMVFGNMGNDSGTGVGFTRNPGTGENQIYGEYLVNAQGEDVVAGIRTPKPIAEMATEMPDIYTQLIELHNRLESHYKEVQDFEFTIEKGRLYCLQTRNGKMNARAMVRTSVEMCNDGLISRDRALMRVEPATLEQLLVPQLSPAFRGKSLAQGLPASPGAASGRIVFDADSAESHGKAGEKIILVREETKPEDIHGFFHAQGILTSRGGKTSHAAVVARGMGKPCVSGCEAIQIDDVARKAVIGDTTLHEGDVVTIDGGTGHVYAGERADGRAGVFGGTEHAARLGRPDRPPRGPRQCRHARRCRQGARLRRQGHRPVPHRAHVQQHRPPAHRPGDDPGRDHRGAPGGAGPPAADPAQRLQGHLQGHEGPAGDGAPARSADARIPADGGAAGVRRSPICATCATPSRASRNCRKP